MGRVRIALEVDAFAEAATAQKVKSMMSILT